MSSKRARPALMLSKSFEIARVTFLELMRDKILYSTILFGIVLLSLSFLLANLSFFKPNRVMLDVGLSGVQISTALIAILAAGSTMNREYERRTVYLILSRPVSRYEFVLGKWLGVVAINSLNLVLLAAIHTFCLHVFAVNGLSDLPTVQFKLLILAWGMSVLFGAVLSAISIWVSAISSTAVTFMIGIGIYLLGTNLSTAMTVAMKQARFTRAIMTAVAKFFPNLESMQINIAVSTAMKPAFREIALSGIHGLAWIIISLYFASRLISKKEAVQ